MEEQVFKNIRTRLGDVTKLYNRLLLLIGQAGAGKTSYLQRLATELDVPILNVNLLLSEKLLDCTKKQRALRVSSLLKEIVGNNSETVILDNIEILFDPVLQANPLALLKEISKHRSVVSSWNGSYSENHLNYAESTHPEYFREHVKDLIFVALDEQNVPVKCSETE